MPVKGESSRYPTPRRVFPVILVPHVVRLCKYWWRHGNGGLRQLQAAGGWLASFSHVNATTDLKLLFYGDFARKVDYSKQLLIGPRSVNANRVLACPCNGAWHPWVIDRENKAKHLENWNLKPLGVRKKMKKVMSPQNKRRNSTNHQKSPKCTPLFPYLG